MLNCDAVNKTVAKKAKWLILAHLLGLMLIINGFAAPEVQAQDPASEIFQLVNNFRVSLGLQPFTWNNQLAAASQTQANWLLANPRNFVHTWPDGTTKEMRAVAAGYNGRVVENIVGGWQMTPQRALTWWQNSPPHYNTITSSFYVEAGTAFAGSGNNRRYVIVVGNRGASAAAAPRAPEPEPIFVEPVILSEPDSTGQIVHTVGKGHALWTLSAYYEVELSDLLLYNDMDENSLVSVGDEIIIQPADGWVPPPTPTPPFSVVVQNGQTLWTIAAIHKIELADLLLFNGLSPDSLISAGDEIKIRLQPGEQPPTFTPTPTPVQKYVIREGDAAWSIAARYDISLDQLYAWNGLPANPLLSVGQELWVVDPGGASATPAAPTVDPTTAPVTASDVSPVIEEQEGNTTVVILPTVTPAEALAQVNDAEQTATPVAVADNTAEELSTDEINTTQGQEEPTADVVVIDPESRPATAINWPLILGGLAALFLLAGGWMFYQSREM